MRGKNRNFFRNPFVPGYGRKPPHLAGRARERSRMYEPLRETARGLIAARDVVIYGPRGMGKTALLRDVSETMAEKKANVSCVLISVNDLTTKEDVRREIVAAAGKPLWKGMLPDSTGVDLEVVKAQWSKGELPYSAARRGVAGRCMKKPMIVMVDEAHALGAEVCNELMNEALTIRGLGGPMAVILAGKPGLAGIGNRADVSFLERAEVIGIGLLEKESAAEAIKLPLERDTMEITRPALEKVAEDTQGYPHFVQLWGSELWKRSNARGGSLLNEDDVSAISPRIRDERRSMYWDRFNAWEAKDRRLLQALARRLKTGGMVGEPRLEEMIGEELGKQGRCEHEVPDVLRKMVETDCVWRRRGKDRLLPSIPSFFDFLEDAERQKNAQEQREEGLRRER